MAQLFFKSAVFAILAASAPAPVAMAEESLVTLIAPADGDKLAAGQKLKAEYEMKPGTKANHVHLFVDGAEVGTAHKLKGSFGYGPLPAGEHKVCVAPVNKGHAAIGGQSCAGVSAQ